MHTDQLIEFTRALVQRPSLSGQEEEVARRVAQEMQALGFDEVQTDAWGNVIGVINGAHPGKTMLLDAHTDTVGISPGVPWEVEPFGGQVKDDAIFGRGSADMKGALAAMVYAAAAVDRNRLHGRVVVSASTLEEVLEGVALAEVMAQFPPDFVVIGEASNLELVRGGRGRAEIHLETVGRPSHSSAPQLGRNAVLDMMEIIRAVEALPLPAHPLMGPAINALTDIISDPYPGHSVIPSICRATYDRRLLPGETIDDVLAPIHAAATAAKITLNATIGTGTYQTFTGRTLVKEKFFPAWLLPEDDAFVRSAQAGLTGIGLTATTKAYRFCTNAAYSAGVAGIPTIGFGPATEADAHVINERLAIDDLLTAAKGYAAIIDALLIG